MADTGRPPQDTFVWKIRYIRNGRTYTEYKGTGKTAIAYVNALNAKGCEVLWFAEYKCSQVIVSA